MKTKKKKVLVLASTFPRWKDDTTPPFVYELEKRLAKDFDIHVLVPHYPGAKKYEVQDDLKIHRFQYFWPAQWQKLCYNGGILPNIKKNKALSLQGITLVVFELINAIRLIRQYKINLIHAHWIIPQGIVAFLLKKTFSVPYIITTHGGDIYGLKNSILQNLKKQILKNAQSITVVSNDIKEQILKIDRNLNVQVVSMGVDSKLFNPSKFNESLISKYNIEGSFLLFVGRLAEKKGVEYLLKAMPTIIKRFPSTKLLIVGSGTLDNHLKELSKKLKVTENVCFTGAIPNHDLPKFYATADIFIGPSITTSDGDTEGLGLTFVEASFSGCIPIGTKVGGISDVIINGKNGFLVNQKSSQSIADAVILLLENKTKLKKLKRNVRNSTISVYDWEIVKSKYANFYYSH